MATSRPWDVPDGLWELISPLLPTPITDGGHILRGLFGWTLMWRHMAVAWVLLELGGAALFLLLGHRAV